MTYFEHMLFAFSISVTSLFVAGILFVHGVLPFAFTDLGSKTIEKLHNKVKK